MKVTFEIGYRTHWGQAIYVCGTDKNLGAWKESKALRLSPGAGEIWKGTIDVSGSTEYKYFLKDEGSGVVFWESGHNRKLEINSERFSNCLVHDHWRPERTLETSLLTSPFMNAFFLREAGTNEVKYGKTGNYIRFQLLAPRVGKNYSVGIVGSSKTLGEWDESNVILMSDEDFPVWKADIKVSDNDLPLQYNCFDYFLFFWVLNW